MMTRTLLKILLSACCLLLAVGPGATAHARTFNIVLSAGSSGNFDAKRQKGCSREHAESCNLYQLKYRAKGSTIHNAGYAISSSQLTNYGSNYSAIFPAVSPSGRYVAFDRQSYVSGASSTHSLRILDMNASTPTHQHLRDDARFPDYYLDAAGQEQIIFTDSATGNIGQFSFLGGASTSRLMTMYWVYTTFLTVEASRVGGGMRSYNDPQVSPANPEWVVFADKDDMGDPTADPKILSVVYNSRTGAFFEVDQTTTDAYLETVDSKGNVTVVREANLAHPAFNMSGDEVVTGSIVHEPYGFSYSGGTKTWVNSRAAPYSDKKMFATFSAAEMASLVTGASPSTAGTGYGQALLDPAKYKKWSSFKVLHSYVQFCQDDDWVVVSVMAARADAADKHDDAKNLTEAEYSRAYLVDIRDRQNPIYYDLILPLEDPDHPYTMEGFGAACYPVNN